MTKDELTYENIRGLNKKSFAKKYPEIYKDLQLWNFPEEFSFMQMLYHYIHNDKNLFLGKCVVCGKRTKFTGYSKGYRKHCSYSCCQKDENILNEKRKSNKEKYGEEKANEMQRKREEAYIKHYGVKNPSQNKQVVERANKSRDVINLKKYGVKCTLCLQSVRNLSKETCLKKYGTENPSSSNEIKEKRKNTFLKKYGVSNPYSIKEVKEKTRENRRTRLLGNKDFVVGFTETGDWICKCTNPNCDKCIEKTYVTKQQLYNDRKRYGYETCTKLNPIGVLNSGREQELLLYIQDIYNSKIIENDRKLLNGKELDIYLPEKKLAFEFNGVYWHSDVYKNKNYHYDKTMSCMVKNIQLIHIWEDDWKYKKDIVKNIIRGKLGLHTNKINARDCVVKEIDTKTAKAFCETYHIQGYTPSQVKLGLYKDNQLVMVCLFSKKRRLIGGKPKEGEWELSRMCSPFDTHVRGGASKLLKHFIKLYNPKTIITFADLSTSNGNVYEKMGFKKEHIVPPTYYWTTMDIRLPRYRFQKSNLVECVEHPELTEDEVMRNRGYVKCWDAGKIKYVININ